MGESLHERPERPTDEDEALIAQWLGDAAASSPDHQVWKDERFLRWIAASNGEPDPLTLGRRVLTRAFCRSLGVLLVDGPPTVRCGVPSPVGEGDAPLIELCPGAAGAFSSSDSTVSRPLAVSASRCIACRVPAAFHAPAPFVHEGDTILLATDADRSAGLFAAWDGLTLAISSESSAAGPIGAVIAIWCEH